MVISLKPLTIEIIGSQPYRYDAPGAAAAAAAAASGSLHDMMTATITIMAVVIGRRQTINRSEHPLIITDCVLCLVLNVNVRSA
jgi:hypothetical protein